MRDRDFEMAIDAAALLETISDDYTSDRRWDRLRSELEAIIARFNHRPADDLPAQALVRICTAWCAMLDCEQQDFDWRTALSDDDDEAA